MTFVMANFVMAIGTWLVIVANEWLAFEAMGMAFGVVIISLSGVLPSMMIGMFTVKVTTRFSRQTVMVTTNILHAIIALGISALLFTKGLTYLTLVCLQLLNGVIGCFEGAVSNAFMEEISDSKGANHTATMREAWRATGKVIAFGIAFVLIISTKQNEMRHLACFAYIILAFAHLLASILIATTKTKSLSSCVPQKRVKRKYKLSKHLLMKSELSLILLVTFCHLVFGTTFFSLFSWLEHTAGITRIGHQYILLRLAGVGGATLIFWVTVCLGWHKSSWTKSLWIICGLPSTIYVIQIIYPLVGSFLLALVFYPFAGAIETITVLAIIRRLQDMEGEDNLGHKFISFQIVSEVAPICWFATSLLPHMIGPRWAIPALGIAGLVSLFIIIVSFWRYLKR